LVELFQKVADSKGGAFGGSSNSQTIGILPKPKNARPLFDKRTGVLHIELIVS